MVKKIDRPAKIPKSSFDISVSGKKKNKYAREKSDDPLVESVLKDQKIKVAKEIPRKKKGEFQGMEHRPTR